MIHTKPLAYVAEHTDVGPPGEQQTTQGPAESRAM